LQKAIREACKGKKPFVCYSLSRLSRNLQDTIELAKLLNTKAGGLVLLSEQVNGKNETANSSLQLNMLGSVGQYVRDVIAESTRATMAHMRKENRRISRHIPFGYDVSEDRLIENPQEQAAIAKMKELRSEGATLLAIAEAMTLPCKSGGTWQAATVYKILKRQEKL
jgi:site-specific DNA recombinase